MNYFLVDIERESIKLAKINTQIFCDKYYMEENAEKHIKDFLQEEYNYQEDKLKKMATKKMNDHEIHELWKKDKFKSDSPYAGQLLKIHRPVINNWLKQYSRNPSVSKEAIEGELLNLWAKSAKTFDASKGAALTTHLHSNLRKIKRFVETHSNMAKIPENRTSIINKYNMSKEYLYDLNNVHPTEPQILEEMNKRLEEEGKKKIKMIELTRLQTELGKKELAESGIIEQTAYTVPREMEAIRFLHSNPNIMEPLEHEVFKKMFPLNEWGAIDHSQKPKLTNIASHLKINPPKMTRITKKIDKYIREATELL